MATVMELEVILAGNRTATRVLVKQRQLKSQQRRTAEIVSVSVLSKVA